MQLITHGDKQTETERAPDTEKINRQTYKQNQAGRQTERQTDELPRQLERRGRGPN